MPFLHTASPHLNHTIQRWFTRNKLDIPQQQLAQPRYGRLLPGNYSQSARDQRAQIALPGNRFQSGLLNFDAIREALLYLVCKDRIRCARLLNTIHETRDRG